ncbi:protein lin-54 homolog isoform X2 [Drosophila montana]|uniref:protein lin-54 homolog isoform X2 n=1 Tax=Drosophila montana TaxID=40370 RepID=UPI00313D55EA
MDTTLSAGADELGDTTPLPELTLYDLLESPATSKEHNMDVAGHSGNVDKDSEDQYVGKKLTSTSSSELLNNPGPKKTPIVRILENKRLTAPMGTALKNMLGGSVRVVTAPTKTTQTMDVKILNKLQTKPLNAYGNAAVKIGSTTIAAPSGSIPPLTTQMPKNISGVTMTQIKTADGKVLYLHKSLPVSGGTAAKLPVNATSRLVSQSILSKGVTLSGTVPIKSTAPSSSITVRGLTAIGATKSTPPTLSNPLTTITTSQTSGLVKSPSSAEPASVPGSSKMPIQVVRTAEGKIIKLNQGVPSVLLNSKSTPLAVRASASTAPAVPTAVLSNSSSRLLNKPSTQVIIKGPLKQLPAGSSLKPVNNNTSSSNNATGSGNTSSSIASATTGATMPSGKMLVQSSTGKQIVVASKNIIKLSPKPGANATTNTNTNTTPSGLHAIQLSGKSGVQYVRVLPNNNTEPTTSPQKVSLGRPRTSSNSNNNSTVSVSNTSKIVMKTMGGSIVPLPSMQTLVPRRAPGTTSNSVHAKTPSNSNNLEATRKHRLSDINVQIKHLTNDSIGDTGGPDAKKARYVIAMPHTSTTSATMSTTTTPASQKHMQKLTGTRAPQMQRVTVQGAKVADQGRKVYNLVTKSDANGVKYMICNKGGEGKPRTVFNTTMRRGYTLAESKLRRPVTLTSQQLRFKQMKLQQQRQIVAQAKLRQQHLQKQQLSTQTKQQQQQQIVKSKSTQDNKLTVPAKPLFDILKPPPTPAPAATAALDALGGSRRKHCNCSKSQCLKLYCDCFANGEFCQDCTCKDCFNNLDYEVKRERAIRSCLERNPSAFKPKITAPNSGDMRLHNKGCNCKRSGCLKNYCECYEAKIPCSAMCKCVGCRNMEDRPDVDMDSMDSLADVKLQSNKMKELNGTHLQDNRSNVYLTDDVIEATIMCMISRIVMHEKQNLPIEDTEREVMEELGESLNQIITFAKEKNDTFHMDDTKTMA